MQWGKGKCRPDHEGTCRDTCYEPHLVINTQDCVDKRQICCLPSQQRCDKYYKGECADDCNYTDRIVETRDCWLNHRICCIEEQRNSLV